MSNDLPLIQIKCRFAGAVRFEGRFGSLRLCVEAAVKADANLAGASLTGAYLAGAYLADADLAGAYLADADLAGAKIALKTGGEAILIGPRPLLSIGPIGSRADQLRAYATDMGLMVQTGCFGPAPLAHFIAAVQAQHVDNEHCRAYRAAVALIEATWPQPADLTSTTGDNT